MVAPKPLYWPTNNSAKNIGNPITNTIKMYGTKNAPGGVVVAHITDNDDGDPRPRHRPRSEKEKKENKHHRIRNEKLLVLLLITINVATCE